MATSPLVISLFLIASLLTGKSIGYSFYQSTQNTQPDMMQADTRHLMSFLYAIVFPSSEDIAEEEADRLSSVIRNVGMGYSLLKGSPDGDFSRGGIDPGILRPIFEFTYKDGNEAFFRQTTVQVPDQVIFQEKESCTTKSQSDAYSGEKSYQSSLSIGGGAEASVYGFRFGLSGALKKANKETAEKKQVFVDQKMICNYGSVQYLKDARRIHQLSKEFIDDVKELPTTYDVPAYMLFLRKWGTNVIVSADVGTKFINRSSYSYNEVYQELSNKKSGGIKLGGSFAGQGGSLNLDISHMKVDEDSDSTLSTQVTTFNIGSRENPYPIYIDLMDIGDTLKQQYWTNKMYKRYRIVQKKSYLMRALEDYADFEGVKELKDPTITIKFDWPHGKYALPAASQDSCPEGWTMGRRTQSTGGDVDWSSDITSHVGVEFGSNTITLTYCVKNFERNPSEAKFEWPKGSYCIARKGADPPKKYTKLSSGARSCPDNFNGGSITWNDHKSKILRKSLNKKWSILPDGIYDKNTHIEYCCRSDGSVSDPMLLPDMDPFVLYRYGGKCQKVDGATVNEHFIKFDDTSVLRSHSACAGNHPDDANCNGDHKIYLCAYTPIQRKTNS